MKKLTVRRTPLVLSTLALAALTAAAGAHAAPVVLEAGTTVAGEAHLITSNPGTFTGVNVANLIGATFNSYTTTGSFSRMAVKNQARVRRKGSRRGTPLPPQPHAAAAPRCRCRRPPTTGSRHLEFKSG